MQEAGDSSGISFNQEIALKISSLLDCLALSWILFWKFRKQHSVSYDIPSSVFCLLSSVFPPCQIPPA